jgi:uncharacterized membrane protein YedE/YeeE
VSDEKRNTIRAYVITAALVIISLLYYRENPYYMYLIVYIWFGAAYGMMLQYGRFCFASASRDLFAAGVPRMAVGILIALVFFSIVQAILAAMKMSTFHPAPFGIHMLISGTIFGVGMVLAGGCASGSLYKVGEGNGTSLVAVVFGLCLGQAIFVDIGGPFKKLLPQSWVDNAQAMKSMVAARGLDMPITSWFDNYLVGYVWQQKTYTMAKIMAVNPAEVPWLMKILPQYWLAKLLASDAPRHATTADFFIGNAVLNSILPAIVLLFVIYYFYPRKGYISKLKSEKGSTGIGDEIAGIWKMITASKRTSIMGVLVGITAGLHIWAIAGMQNRFHVSNKNFGELLVRMGHTGDVTPKKTVFDPGYWYITSQEGQVGAWILEKFGWNMHDNMFFGWVNGIPELWRNPALWMSLGIIFGAMIMALLQKEYKWKWPTSELLVWGLAGGLLMGFGSRPSLGCNIGGFFIRASGGDPNGWVYGTGMVLGAFIGVKFFNWYTERKMAKEMEDFDIEL